MEKRFRIGEISKFFDLPASTLRYWDELDLLAKKKNIENNYREYTVDDFMEISDVIFYKSLGIPLKQIPTLECSSTEKHEALFQEKRDELKRKQTEIELQIKKLNSRLEKLEILEALKQNPFQREEIDTECIVSFNLTEIEKIRQYIENPYLYSRVQHSKELEKEMRGLTISRELMSCFPKSEIIWENKKSQYLTCLMKEEVHNGFQNDLPVLLKKIQKTHKTGVIISRFLLRAQECGKLYDYYKSYVEILD